MAEAEDHRQHHTGKNRGRTWTDDGERRKSRGASRTDAGVHARGQVANVQLPDEFTAEEIGDYLNRYLPEDIGVLEVKRGLRPVSQQAECGEKTYLYQFPQIPLKMFLSESIFMI